MECNAWSGGVRKRTLTCDDTFRSEPVNKRVKQVRAALAGYRSDVTVIDPSVLIGNKDNQPRGDNKCLQERSSTLCEHSVASSSLYLPGSTVSTQALSTQALSIPATLPADILGDSDASSLLSSSSHSPEWPVERATKSNPFVVAEVDSQIYVSYWDNNVCQIYKIQEGNDSGLTQLQLAVCAISISGKQTLQELCNWIKSRYSRLKWLKQREYIRPIRRRIADSNGIVVAAADNTFDITKEKAALVKLFRGGGAGARRDAYKEKAEVRSYHDKPSPDASMETGDDCVQVSIVDNTLTVHLLEDDGSESKTVVFNTESSKKPACELGHLVALALSTFDKPVPVKDVCEWVRGFFPYYQTDYNERLLKSNVAALMKKRTDIFICEAGGLSKKTDSRNVPAEKNPGSKKQCGFWSLNKNSKKVRDFLKQSFAFQSLSLQDLQTDFDHCLESAQVASKEKKLVISEKNEFLYISFWNEGNQLPEVYAIPEDRKDPHLTLLQMSVCAMFENDGRMTVDDIVEWIKPRFSPFSDNTLDKYKANLRHSLRGNPLFNSESVESVYSPGEPKRLFSAWALRSDEDGLRDLFHSETTNKGDYQRNKYKNFAIRLEIDTGMTGATGGPCQDDSVDLYSTTPESMPDDLLNMLECPASEVLVGGDGVAVSFAADHFLGDMLNDELLQSSTVPD